MPSLVNVSVFMNCVVITELYCLYWTIKIRQTKKLRMIWNDVSHRVKKTKCSHPTSWFYSSCCELDAFETLFSIQFGKKTVGSCWGIACNCYDLLYLHRHYHIESRFLKYGQETSSYLSSLKQPRKLEVQDLYGKNNYF